MMTCSFKKSSSNGIFFMLLSIIFGCSHSITLVKGFELKLVFLPVILKISLRILFTRQKSYKRSTYKPRMNALKFKIWRSESYLAIPGLDICTPKAIWHTVIFNLVLDEPTIKWKSVSITSWKNPNEAWWDWVKYSPIYFFAGLMEIHSA